MSVKLLISAESNGGKTTLTKSLTDALVVSHDGKRYPYAVPHIPVATFDSTSELIALINEKIIAYKEKYGKYPSTIVFDSISKIFDTILDYCSKKHTGFKVYSTLNQEITELMSYIENTLSASDMNIVLISHAIWDQDTAKYNLVGQGNYQKRGGALSETDYALFIEAKSSKRIIHFRSTKFPARTLNEEDPDNLPISDFNLQDYITKLNAISTRVNDFAL